MKNFTVILALCLVSLLLPILPIPGLVLALWPAVCALTVIIFTKQAALGLGTGVMAGAFLIHPKQPLEALRSVFADHVFPSLDGTWHVGAIVFTLILGSFAGLLEKSGGFDVILSRLIEHGKNPQKRLLGGVYGLGLLCFFDGLANSMLVGRIARPLADRAGVSRERLAWVVDSTSSPVACVAFVSTWIATQLSLIQDGLKNADFPVEPYALFFQSIPANPYCLLTLILVPLAIYVNYQPRAMSRYPAHEPEQNLVNSGNEASPLRVIIPLVALAVGIFFAFPLLSSPMENPLSLKGWQAAFSGEAGPYALVAGSLFGLVMAWLMYPKGRSETASTAAYHGAANLLPAIVILVLAWSLGSIFTELGAGRQLAELLSERFEVKWLPLAVFVAGSVMSFATGSSWGTMGLLMPLALPATLTASQGMPGTEVLVIIPAVIGAVFGGAVFGDHCSPFSDTTIVSATASGCETTNHVHSQLPFAAMVAGFAALSYALMAFGLSSWIATAITALLMIFITTFFARRS